MVPFLSAAWLPVQSLFARLNEIKYTPLFKLHFFLSFTLCVCVCSCVYVLALKTFPAWSEIFPTAVLKRRISCVCACSVCVHVHLCTVCVCEKLMNRNSRADKQTETDRNRPHCKSHYSIRTNKAMRDRRVRKYSQEQKEQWEENSREVIEGEDGGSCRFLDVP